MPLPPDVPPLRQRLRAALPSAMRAGDRAVVSALRSALAAIENAEAVDPPGAAAGHSGALERSPVGAGATEVARRELTEAEVERLVRTEVADREAVANEYERAGRHDYARRLRHEAEALAAHLA
jgi:uncharacterized protein YqeY